MASQSIPLTAIAGPRPRPHSSPPPRKPVRGYPALAHYMGSIPESAVFRRFQSLTALDLLYRQAELHDLLEDLEKCQEKDDESTTGRQNMFAVEWHLLAHGTDGINHQQWSIVEEIRPKLKEYQLLTLSTKAAELPAPRRYDLRHLQRFLKGEDMGEYGLIGRDATIWGSEEDPGPCADDLVSLKLRRAEDVFSIWVSESLLLRWYRCVGHRFKRPDPRTGLIGYEDEKILRVTYAISSCIAAILPTASVIVLYFLGSMIARLVAVALFAFVFALSMRLFSTAKTSEVFAATAAYAAVQVVFVSANQSTSSAS